MRAANSDEPSIHPVEPPVGFGSAEQGDYSWRRSGIGALPDAHIGVERYGDHCPGIWHRSVFVEWRDYEGNYGYEQVNY